MVAVNNTTEDLYRIGTVAQLTGIAVERLRAWERRYALAPSQKSGKTRFYSTEQVQWLQSVKQLLDQGQPIGSLIHLTQEQISNRLGGSQTERPASDGFSADLIGTGLLLLEHQQSRGPQFSVVSRATNIDQWLERRDSLEQPPTADLIVVQAATIDLPQLLQLRDSADEAPLLVLYEFATQAQGHALAAEGFTALRWPQSLDAIEQAAAGLVGRPLRPAERLPRRFDDETLIALAASGRAEDSAHAHLARLINELNSFSEFTDTVQRDAVRDSRRPPLSGAVHERVSIDLSQARALLEQALDAVIDAGAEG